jgi:hypothetical protein
MDPQSYPLFEIMLNEGQILKISEQEARNLQATLNRIFGVPVVAPPIQTWVSPWVTEGPTWDHPIATCGSSDASNDPT